MDLDDVNLGIMEKYLMSLFGKGCAIIRVMDTLAIQKFHEHRNIVSTKGYMTSLNRIDDLTVLEDDSQVLARQVHLHLAICGKSDLSFIAA